MIEVVTITILRHLYQKYRQVHRLGAVLLGLVYAREFCSMGLK